MTKPVIRASQSLNNVRYEIRGRLARRAHEMERMGYEVISLNIGNPGAFGFRTPETIRRAWTQFTRQQGVDSLRAVEKCAQHPGKMWIVEGDRMRPFWPRPDRNGPPYHSMPYQALPPVYVQNASLEIAWTRVVAERRTIAGDVVVPFAVSL